MEGGRRGQGDQEGGAEGRRKSPGEILRGLLPAGFLLCRGGEGEGKAGGARRIPGTPLSGTCLPGNPLPSTQGFPCHQGGLGSASPELGGRRKTFPIPLALASDSEASHPPCHLEEGQMNQGLRPGTFAGPNVGLPAVGRD